MSTLSQRLVIEGKRYILLREAEYESLCREAGRFENVPDDDLPALPKADRRGRVPAVEYSRVSLARDLIRQRKAAGLSQQQLADAARVRQETISRIESGKHSVTIKTWDKIFKALETAQRKKGK
ncbi:MAG TPA: helix-turn-helix transcriptional regulator [Pirellulales bacterium]|jgi:DNA-binding XRE family transcriptional regulator|nr:helix-turn-helix transcriptional regulator [Pirellulales bacterium]